MTLKRCREVQIQRFSGLGYASIVECKITLDGSKDVILFSAKLQCGSIWGGFLGGCLILTFEKQWSYDRAHGSAHEIC